MSQSEHHTPQYINNGSGYGGPVIIQAKSIVVAYVLWFFLGIFGIHKFYLRSPFLGIFYLLLHGLGWLTAPIFIGYFFFVILGLLLLIDLFTIPFRVAFLNAAVQRRRF